MEPVFQRFDSFDFEADRRFVDGLRALQASGGGEDPERVLNLKLFFYNRYVEPIDCSLYKQQKNSPVAAGDQAAAAALSDCDDGETDTAEAPQQLSFKQVIRLIQAGKEVPGTLNLDIRPSNRSPTPSQMSRRTKPWETN